MSGFNTDAITFNTTAGNKTVAITPKSGDLIFAVCANTGTTTDPIVTDNRGGTYTRLATAVKAASADEMHVYVRDQVCGAPVSHTLTMDIGGTGSGGGINAIAVSGLAKYGVAAVLQTAVQDNQGAGTPVATFTNPIDSRNTTIFAVFNATNPAGLSSPGPNVYQELRDVGYATPTTGLEVTIQSLGQSGTTITAGSASASAFCTIGVELDSATPTSYGSGRLERPGQPGEMQRRRPPKPAMTAPFSNRFIPQTVIIS